MTERERYYWVDENVPNFKHGRLNVCDRHGQLAAIAVCTDPDVAERLVRLLNADEAAVRKEPTK